MTDADSTMSDDEKRAEIARLQAELDAGALEEPAEVPAASIDAPDAVDAPSGMSGGAMVSVLIVVAIAVVGLFAWALTAGGDDDSSDALPRAPFSAADEVFDSSRTVMYEVTGTAESVSVTMETPTGTSQNAHANVPLAFEGGAPVAYTFSAGDFVYLSAQNNGESGSVTCVIRVEGMIVSTVTSSGGYVIASCDGSA